MVAFALAGGTTGRAATCPACPTASPAGANAAASPPTPSPLTGTPLDFFTNYGRYMPRTHCMVDAAGRPDWPWIIGLTSVTALVVAGYLRIVWFWRRAYLQEQEQDRNVKLMQLAYIFLLCAVCGYAMSMLAFVWPAYRLLTFLMVVLAGITWRFIYNLNEFGVSFTARRYERLLREQVAARTAELERCVEAATADLRTQAVELARTRDAAEAANRAKSDFLATMSHEIRTPLNGVIGTLRLLTETGLTGDQQRFATTADASAHTLLSLINDILDFSKVEAGKLELDPVPFDLSDLAATAVEIVATAANAKGLGLTCTVDPAVPRRRIGAADRIRQVLVNLLGNAVKFTATGAVSVRVTPADGDAVRFAVTDTGIGIPPDRLDRLFQSFSQVDASTTRKFGGTGLGLAICKQLAALMGGTVGVRSTVGVGSTFWFTARLPVDAAPGPTAGAAPVPRAAPPGGRRILVAEDNDVNQMVIGEMLRRLGHSVALVADGRAAVAAARAGGHDLILMDCQMPEMDGFAAAAAVRAAEAGSDRRLPILALTANAVVGDRERCLSAGMDDYLTKPIDSAALAAKLSLWLNPTVAEVAA